MLKRFKPRFNSMAAALIAATMATSAHAVSLSTGDFTGWLPRVYGENGGTSSITLLSSGGNPGAHVQINNTTNAFTSFVISGLLFPELVVAPSGIWESTLSIDFTTNVNPGGDQHAMGVLAEQEGRLYWLSLGVTGVASGGSTFTSAAFSFDGEDFGASYGGGAGALDLSQPFYAGFATANSRSFTRGSSYDNLSLEGVVAAAPIPLPAPLLLLAGALGGLGVFRLRRRATA